MRLATLAVATIAGCAHPSWPTQLAAQERFFGPYARALGAGCGERFVLERHGTSEIITTSPGIVETKVRIEACGASVATTLDCKLPHRGRGWVCWAHTLPTPEPGRGGLVTELGVLHGAVEDAGCTVGGRGRLVGDVRIARTGFHVDVPSGHTSQWTVDGCGHAWVAETRCPRDHDCAVVRFGAASAPPPAAPPSVGALRVRVVDPAGEPMLGARVTLETPEAPVLTPDHFGQVTFEGLPPGTYAVRITGDGWQPVQRGMLLVVAGKITIFDAELTAE